MVSWRRVSRKCNGTIEPRTFQRSWEEFVARTTTILDGTVSVRAVGKFRSKFESWRSKCPSFAMAGMTGDAWCADCQVPHTLHSAFFRMFSACCLPYPQATKNGDKIKNFWLRNSFPSSALPSFPSVSSDSVPQIHISRRTEKKAKKKRKKEKFLKAVSA